MSAARLPVEVLDPTLQVRLGLDPNGQLKPRLRDGRVDAV
jgi:hypothetical protein